MELRGSPPPPPPGGDACLENVYTCQDDNVKPLPSVAQEFAKPCPYWHKIWAQIHTLTGTNPKKGTLYGTNVVQKWFIGKIVGQFSAIFYIFHSLWHNHWKTHTLFGTLLVFKTLLLVAHRLKTLPSVALKLAKMVPWPSQHTCTAVNGSDPPPPTEWELFF